MFGSGVTTLIILNEEINDIIKVVKSLEESGWLIKDVSKTIKNEAEEQKGGFLKLLLGILGSSLLGNVLSGKGKVRAGEGTAATSQGPKIKGGEYVINLDEFESVRTHWISFYINANNIIYFGSLEVVLNECLYEI